MRRHVHVNNSGHYELATYISFFLKDSRPQLSHSLSSRHWIFLQLSLGLFERGSSDARVAIFAF